MFPTTLSANLAILPCPWPERSVWSRTLQTLLLRKHFYVSLPVSGFFTDQCRTLASGGGWGVRAVELHMALSYNPLTGLEQMDRPQWLRVNICHPRAFSLLLWPISLTPCPGVPIHSICLLFMIKWLEILYLWNIVTQSQVIVADTTEMKMYVTTPCYIGSPGPP